MTFFISPFFLPSFFPPFVLSLFLSSFPSLQSTGDGLSVTMRKYKRYCERAAQSPPYQLMPYSDFCALLIQHWWRNLSKPWYPGPPPPTTDGAISIITTAGPSSPGKGSRKESGRKSNFDREQASKVIQRAWRKHIVRYTPGLLSLHAKGVTYSRSKFSLCIVD